jgi:hypothetical protein
MASKKSKMLKLLAVVIAVGVGGYFAWKKFLQKDKMGGTMTVDSTPAGGGDNVIYNGKKVYGWIAKGSLKVQNGYWTGIGSDGAMYQYREGGWVQL